MAAPPPAACRLPTGLLLASLHGLRATCTLPPARAGHLQGHGDTQAGGAEPQGGGGRAVWPPPAGHPEDASCSSGSLRWFSCRACGCMHACCRPACRWPGLPLLLHATAARRPPPRRSCVPGPLSPEAGLIYGQGVLLVARTLLTDHISWLEGRAGRWSIQRDVPRLLRVMAAFVGVSIPAALVTAGLKYMQARGPWLLLRVLAAAAGCCRRLLPPAAAAAASAGRCCGCFQAG